MGVFISLLQLVYSSFIFHMLATRHWIFFLSFFCGIPIKGRQLWKFCIIHFLLMPLPILIFPLAILFPIIITFCHFLDN